MKEDPFEYHDIRRIFPIRKIPSVTPLWLGSVGYFLGLVTFGVSAGIFSLFQKDALFYTRDEFIALCLRLCGRRVVWEGHTGQRNSIVRILIRLGVPFVVITTALKDLYVSFGVEPANILVAPDGADITRFNIPLTQADARKELCLPLDKTVVLYKGHLYEQKGAHTIARAAPLLVGKAELVFIGGNEPDVEAFKKEFDAYENVHILGNKPRRETPIYQKAADFLVIPNSAKDDVSKLYTSPMKLFGYMASGVPIIASDLPSLREILDESLVYFFTPDSPESFAEVLVRALATPEESKKKGEATLVLAGEHSWQKRAQRIVEFMKRNS